MKSYALIDFSDLTIDELGYLDCVANSSDDVALHDAVMLEALRRVRDLPSPPLIHHVPPKIAKLAVFFGLWAQKRQGGGGGL